MKHLNFMKDCKHGEHCYWHGHCIVCYDDNVLKKQDQD